MPCCKAVFLLTTAIGAALISAEKVKAQPASQLQEIIVTARKRQESILNVPVVETAIPAVQLQRFKVQDLKDVQTMTPGLILGDNVLSIGTLVSIRGVGTTSSDPGVDASVSLNLDGLQLSQGLAYQMAMFDMAQVEVLKGPQALFYGKSSPGGVISIRTNDPTNQLEVIGRAGYEFEAQQKQGQIIVSGPVTNTLKLRLATQYDQQNGFYFNTATGIPALGGLTPAESRIGGSRGYMLRLTALWDPTDRFSARLKVNQTYNRTLYASSLSLLSCPSGTGPVFGIPFINSNDNCQRGRDIPIVDLNPAAFPGIPNEGAPYLESTQSFGTLELNYRARPDLTLTSVTGYYLLHSTSMLNADMASEAGPTIGVTNGFHRRELTEELRANSDFSGPLNFTAGLFVQRAQFSDLVDLFGNTFLGYPAQLEAGANVVDIRTNSAYGQLRYKILPQLEVALGARLTDEKRTDTATEIADGVSIPYNLAAPFLHSKNTSPELTITYKPTADATIFGSLKRGYKSGSFSVATPPPYAKNNNAFGDETVDGGEVGVKTRWFDRRLAFDIAGYDYRYTGLQVGAITPTESAIPAVQTINAGSSRIRGVESDATYYPQWVENLTLRASVAWEHSQFKKLDGVPCYGGQTIADGCNEDFSPFSNNGLGGFNAQNQAGLPLPRAPKWQSTFGFDYTTDIGNGMNLVLAINTLYSSKYLDELGLIYYQPSFFKTDLSVTLQGPHDRWELALIGKNLNDALTSGNCGNSNIRGGLLPGTEITGTNLVGPAGVDQVGCYMDRGREVWLQVTLKPFS